MGAWYKKFHHTEVYDTGKKVNKNGKAYSIIFKGLASKIEYSVSEALPSKKPKQKGEAQLPSRNNKHPYILRGRYV